MKWLYHILLLFLIACKKDQGSDSLIESLPPVLLENQTGINEVIPAFYIAVPHLYNSTQLNYPLILFIHGAGQYGKGGTELSLVLRESIPELLDKKLFPPNFKVDYTNFSFITLIPQFSRQPTSEEILSLINFARSSYRIDESRIYITGISEGAEVVCNFASDYPNQVAAIVPMAGAPRSGNITIKSKNVAEGNLPVWLFHNLNDEVIDIQYSQNFIELINSFSPTFPPKFTKLQTFGLYGHDAWTKASDPKYKEEGKNIYEWMLQYKR
jgi:predicted peptidase